MDCRSLAFWLLSQEARALLTRVDRIRPFALQETMVSAAALSSDAQIAIERHIAIRRQELKQAVHEFLSWLESDEGRRSTPSRAQRRFTFLRLRFNSFLTQFDIFSEAMTQRSEAETGIWLSGLDAVARDALALPGYLPAPPVVCYLARGPGAAIRRARTRLPGGGENPIAIIRVPRERMIGAGLASSLVHEVGHQGAALLNLVESLRHAMRALPVKRGSDGLAWDLWQSWISEIIADTWAIAKVGVTSTLGLIAVVSLPRAFVFRTTLGDPHPMPWIRVKVSCAIGDALYPHPGWKRMARVWEDYYPRTGLDAQRTELLSALERTLPEFAEFLVGHRPESLARRPLREALASPSIRPEALSALYRGWASAPQTMKAAPPSLVFAAVGHARAEGTITPERESAVLASLLKYWALKSTLDASAICATQRVEASRSITPLASYPMQAVH